MLLYHYVPVLVVDFKIIAICLVTMPSITSELFCIH